MTARRSGPYQNVVLTADVLADLHQIEERSIDVLAQVFRLLEQLDNGTLQPTRLQNFAKTADPTDCGKFVVLVDGEPEHRIVVRDPGGSFQVSDVVAVDNRTNDLPYVLAGLRLERQGDPIRRSDASRSIARIRRALDQPDETGGRPSMKWFEDPEPLQRLAVRGRAGLARGALAGGCSTADLVVGGRGGYG